MFKCKKCGSNRFKTKFVCDCGRGSETGICLNCGILIRTSMVYCADCNELNNTYVDDKKNHRAQKKKENFIDSTLF